VAQPSPVNENILGTQIFGNACLNGNVNVSLLPMRAGIGLQLDLNACMTSQSRGYNRGVVLNTSSTSPILASKQVFVSESGIASSAPYVATQLTSTINSIEHRSRLVRRIASRKASKTKPQADAIAESRLQNKVGTQFSEQVDQQVAQLQPQFASLRNTKLPVELRRVGFQMPNIQVESTESEIQCGVVQRASFELAAPRPCPFSRPAASVVAQLHESAINNSLATIMSGRTIRNSDLGDLVKQLTGRIPKELDDEIEGEAWSVTFNTTAPVRVELDDDNVRLTLRIIRATRQRQTLSDPLSITVTYAPSFDNRQLKLKRVGEVTVTSDRQTRSTGGTALRAFIKKKVDDAFKDELTRDVDLQQFVATRFPRASSLGIQWNRLSYKMDEGWLQIALP
jgi:hypothetical protein